MIKREKYKKVSEKLQITFFLTTFALDFYYLPILLITKTNKTMKKNIMRFAVVALALFAMPTFMHAQLGKLANKAKAAANTAKTLNSEENLIGDEEITEKDLKATWSYREPGLSFAKGNAAVKAAGNKVAQEVEPEMREALSALKPGMISFKFEEKGVCTLIAQKKEIPATYTVSGPDITITLSDPAATLKFNGRIDGNRIQLSMLPDDLIGFIKAAMPDSADQYAAKLEPVTKALSKVKIVYIALWFAK